MTINWRDWRGQRTSAASIQAHAKKAARDIRDAQATAAAVVDGDTIVVATRGPSDLVLVYEATLRRVGEESDDVADAELRERAELRAALAEARGALATATAERDATRDERDRLREAVGRLRAILDAALARSAVGPAGGNGKTCEEEGHPPCK